MTRLAVLTRDLRLRDNPVLGTDDAVVPSFVIDPALVDRHASPNRNAFLSESLLDLDRRLTEAGSSLVVRTGPWIDTIAELAREASASEIHVARDVSATSQRRLEHLRAQSPVPVVTHDSLTIVPPDAVAPSGGDFYQVFTPFFRKWANVPRRTVADRSTFTRHDIASEAIWQPPTVETSPDRLLGGERRGEERLLRWLDQIAEYPVRRDRLDDTTSLLSADLHFGTVSPLVVAEMAADRGADSFVRQLAWRDFNHHVLYHRPEASWLDYRDAGAVWNNDPEGFDAWTAGQTGFPIVDAAMRQLRATGWMHNRARMVAASFLTKDLMIDWRLGARWFMTWLTDGDVANNQLGWQWVAGTGTDTNPTRIFNPTLQSQRHDPDGSFIRRWIPELADVSADEIHDPSPLTRAATGYPLPIVDHREAIRSYKEARGWG